MFGEYLKVGNFYCECKEPYEGARVIGSERRCERCRGLIQDYHGQDFFHKYNSNIKKTEENWHRKGTMKNIILAIVLFLSFAAVARGQDQKPQFFSFTSQATVLRLNGESTPGTFLFGALALTPTFGIGPETFLAPGINAQYYGGAVHKTFSFEKALTKTQLPKKSFQAYVHGSLGVARNVPATGLATQHYAGFLRGGLNYDPTGSGKFTVNLVDAGAAFMPGFPAGTRRGNWGLTVAVGIKLTP